jgi:hypothetical protein
VRRSAARIRAFFGRWVLARDDQEFVCVELPAVEK